MMLRQVFKTLAGAQKRAAFETAHCQGRWHYSAVANPDGPGWRLNRRVKGEPVKPQQLAAAGARCPRCMANFGTCDHTKAKPGD